jgi:DNA-binding MarR family transcriptional regulator
MQALGRQLEEDAGISLTDYEVLANLSDMPDRRMRMRELATVTLSTRSGATRAVARLEKLGWVRRVTCGEDRRGMFAELTDEGAAKLAASAPGHVAAVRANMIDLLSPEDAAQVRKIGERMLAHQLASPPAAADVPAPAPA